VARSNQYFRGNFAGITEEAMLHLVRDKVSPRARWILAIMIMSRDYEKPLKEFPCPMRKLRALSGFSFATIRHRTKELERHGIVQVERHGGLFRSRNEYTINTGYLGILS
jgi:hypothetical protein